MNTEFIDSFRRPKLHGNFVLDLNPFSKLNLCVLIAAFAGVAGGVVSSLVAILLYIAITAWAGCLKKFWGLFWKVGALLFFFIFMIRSAFWPGTTLLFEWWIVHWTVEGMQNGLWFSLLVIQICGAVMLFYNITPMKDLMYSIEMLGASHSASYVILSSMQTITDLGPGQGLQRHHGLAERAGHRDEGQSENALQGVHPHPGAAGPGGHRRHRRKNHRHGNARIFGQQAHHPRV